MPATLPERLAVEITSICVVGSSGTGTRMVEESYPLRAVEWTTITWIRLVSASVGCDALIMQMIMMMGGNSPISA